MIPRDKQDLRRQGTDGLLLAMKQGAKPLKLDTPEGMDLLFIFLSGICATNLITREPEVSVLLLCGLEARYELFEPRDKKALESVFRPLETYTSSEEWANLIEFLGKQKQSYKLAAEAILGYKETFSDKWDPLVEGPPFDERYLWSLTQQMRVERTMRMIENVKETVDLTPEEKGFLDRITAPLISEEDFTPGQNDHLLTETINKKVGFQLIAPQNPDEG